MLDRKLPAVCDFSVTNVCNAACDFCGYARDKTLIGERRYADADAFARALPILHRRGIRYMTLQGGEPLVHPDIIRLVADTAAVGIQCAIITNGWFLPRYIDSLAAAGLGRLIISIDSAELGQHERNRGLGGLGHRRLGFDLVAFSYPRRDPFGSTSLVYGGESALVDLDRDELLAALTAIARVKKRFPVANPTASLTEITHFVRGEQQSIPCVGGYKYFYLDWNLDIWRCEAWSEPLGSVFDLDRIPDQRQPCHDCTMACYRNASMLMHAGIAATEALHALRTGDIGTTMASLFRRSVALSIWALVEELPHIRRLARRKRRQVVTGAAIAAASHGGARGTSGMTDSRAMLPEA
jgi:MoaA/NifB/PqqE/SkfB family radical SAM enzyme